MASPAAQPAATKAPVAPKVEKIDAGRKRAMCNMINSERFSDVTFVVQNRKVFGHRAILAAYSDYLDAQFCGPYLDSGGDVPIEGIQYDAFINVILPYIYTGELVIPEDEDLMSVLEHADRWQLEDLTRFIAAHICDSNHLDGHICIQALNFAKHHCTFDGLILEKDSPELWSGMYQECLKYFEKHGTDMIKSDPSILTHIESDDLMYTVLSRITLESLPSRILMELGRVFLLWLKADSENAGSPIDTLFEVLAHMKTLSDISDGSKAQSLVKINVSDVTSESWSCPNEIIAVPSFANTVHVQKSKAGEHLGVFFTQSTECDFMNRWPLRARISVHLEATARRTSKAAKDFSCEFTKQWRDREQGQGFPEFVSLADLKPNGKYVHDGYIHMNVSLAIEPHPVFRLCMLFASCGFQQIREHPKLSTVDSSLLKSVLTCDRLDAKTESEVLEVVTKHLNMAHTRGMLVAEMLECIRFAYVPVNNLANAYGSSPVLRKSDCLKKRIISSLRSTEDGIVCGRRSYVEDDVQLTLEALVDSVLCGSPSTCFSGSSMDVEDTCPAVAPDAGPCQCAIHKTKCHASESAPKTKLEFDDDEDEETLDC